VYGFTSSVTTYGLEVASGARDGSWSEFGSEVAIDTAAGAAGGALAFGAGKAASAGLKKMGGATSQRLAAIIDDGLHPQKGPLAKTNAGAGEKVLFHYTDDVGRAGIRRDGVIKAWPTPEGPRAYISPTRYSDGLSAQADLAMKRTPTGFFEVPASRIDNLQGPYRVQPRYGQPGNGLECWTACDIDAANLVWHRLGAVVPSDGRRTTPKRAASKRFMASYDYGQGAIWAYVWAPSKASLMAEFPELDIHEAEPSHWTDEARQWMLAKSTYILPQDGDRGLLGDIKRSREKDVR
jgi:hypothetical protein